MENLEKLTSEESAKEKEINEALNSFSEEMMRLEREINNKDIKPWTKEEMQAYLNSGEFKKRIDEYILVNGEKISVANIEMDATTGLLKMKYKVKMDNVEKELTTYLQIAGETNNSYLQFKKNPAAKTEATSVELYENNGKKNLSLDEEYK